MTQLNMYKLIYKSDSNHSIYNHDVAQDIIENYIKDANENALIVLHGPHASGKSSISEKVDIYAPDIDYKVVHLKQVHETYKIAELHDDKTIVAIISDMTDMQKINVCFHTLHNLHRDKPVVMLLELLTP